MAASKTDKFKKVGASTVTTLAAPGKALGASSITVGSTTNYPTDTGIVITIRRVDSDGKLIDGTITEWEAVVTSDTTLDIDTTPVFGDDQVYPAGSSTQVYISASAYAQNALIEGILATHNQDGTIKDDIITLDMLATTLKNALYPIGSIYTNASVATNPATLLGFGTWEAFGAGKVMVGLNAAETEFDTLGETGGAKTHTLTSAQSGVPAHTHTVDNSYNQASGGGAYFSPSGVNVTNSSTLNRGGRANANSTADAAEAHNNLQPYIVVHMWKRTA